MELFFSLSSKSSQLMPRTELHINAPRRHKMGPEARGGTADTTGAIGMARRKHSPVVNEAIPDGSWRIAIEGSTYHVSSYHLEGFLQKLGHQQHGWLMGI